jgi:hypothetical protein
LDNSPTNIGDPPAENLLSSKCPTLFVSLLSKIVCIFYPVEGILSEKIIDENQSETDFSFIKCQM